MSSNISLRAFLALAEMAVTHFFVAVEFGDFLSFATLEALFHIRIAPGQTSGGTSESLYPSILDSKRSFRHASNRR